MLKCLYFLINLFLLLLCQEDTFVDTKFGRLKGFKLDLIDNKKVNIFLGVPFAKPPISELRFEVFTHVFIKIFYFFRNQ